MVVQISSTDKRSVRALEVLRTADRWHRGHTHEGRSFYAVPSSTDPNRFYMTDTRACNCPDFTYRSEAGIVCAHVLAVRLRVAQLVSAGSAVRRSAPARSTREANQVLYGHGDEDEPRRPGPPLVARIMA